MGERDTRATRALVVDDERFNREILVANLRSAGYDSVTAEDGEQAWAILDRNPDGFDVVLLDRRMPRLDGMALLARLKADPRLDAIPVIMQTAYASAEDVADGIAAGVYYYLAKPLDRRLLLSVTAAAVEDYQRLLRLREDLARRATALTLMESGRFSFRTLDEAHTLAVALARGCPRSGNLVMGLSEIFTNAVEHGNLGIGFEEKTRLLADRRWSAEVAARLAAPGTGDRRVEVEVRRGSGEVRITVRDQGDGFDWRRYVELDPSRAFAAHGRGIAMARRLAFDALDYRDPGNEVACVVRDRSSRPNPTAVAAGASTTRPPSAGGATVAVEDLAAARAMQADLLPAPERLAWLERRFGCRVTAHFETSCSLGGDLWGAEPLDDGRFALWLADFSGHGVAAALNTFRLHTLMGNLALAGQRPGEVLTGINRRLAGLLPVGQFATMLYGVVDAREGRFTYAAAATPHPMVAAPGHPPRLGDGSGLPLGVAREMRYEDRWLALPAGSLLFLASDGLQDGMASDGARLGTSGVARLVERATAGQSAHAGVGAILAPFLAGARRPLQDDLTALCCLLPG